jgi:hypothetical protein
MLNVVRFGFNARPWMEPTPAGTVARGMVLAVFWSLVQACCLAAESPLNPYQPAVRLCELEHDDIDESSGLACSRLSSDVFWTHNDQGDKPRLFAFGIDGRHLGTSKVESSDAEDWEDLASFRAGGRAYLAIGDIGDNERSRHHCTIYIVPEPANPKKDTRVARRIDFTYSDFDDENASQDDQVHSHDCEALGFDPIRGEFLLIEKRKDPSCRVYLLPWARKNEMAIARQIGRINAPLVTAMDISPDGLRAVVLTRYDARVFTRSPSETWAEALRGGEPDFLVTTPTMGQREAICFGPDGQMLYLTTEGIRPPFYRISPRTADSR